METTVKLSPRQMHGTIWDENGKTKIVQILISYNEYSVCSIQFVYDVDGKVVSSKMHGNPCGSKFETLTFDYPNESLVSLSGEHHMRGIASIAFGTNKRTYGPFGKKVNLEYNFYGNFDYKFAPKSMFGGFHGCVNYSYLYGIGVYVKPIGSLAEIEKYNGGDNPEIEKDNGGVMSDDYKSPCN